jgi:hypothetical protein
MNDHTYCWARLDGGARNPEVLMAQARGPMRDDLERRGGVLYGMFVGWFGIGSGELIVVTSMAPSDGSPDEPLSQLAGTRVVEKHLLRPTVRPTSTDALTRPGLYVSRFFHVKTVDVDEVVRLSQEAWRTFETSSAYRSEPQALWRTAYPTEQSDVLLLTWYDNFTSWEVSRDPAPAARDNFRRRHTLTSGTIAYATRLVVD